MANEREIKTNYTIYEHSALGNIQIADEVIAVIAGIAATEVEGVAEMNGGGTKEIIARLGMKSLSKGVRVKIEDQKVSVELEVVLDYGVSIPKVTAEMQEKVKNAIETMTGLEVENIDIRVSDVNFENE